MDNCCFNRPYDDQTQPRISLETQAKLYIQQKIKDGTYFLVWSYILDYENSKNPYQDKREAIAIWSSFAKETIIENEEIIQLAQSFSSKGIKSFDALHLACAVITHCDYFITTDKKLLNSSVEGLRIVGPIPFVVEQEV